MNSPLPLLRRFAALYSEKRLSRASAALSFFLTSTLFPLLIILYTLLGNSPERIGRILDFVRQVMAGESADTIEEFLRYVANNNSRSMMTAALLLLLSSRPPERAPAGQRIPLPRRGGHDGDGARAARGL